jgi:isocitrate dehydrogenase (NAD+)
MHLVARIRGDGIGPEISDATLQVLETAGAEIDWVDVPVGRSAVKACGEELPSHVLDRLRELQVILKSPLIADRCTGGVALSSRDGERRYPSINNALRRELGLFVNVRPVRGWGAISGSYQSLDVVIMREVTEDIYIGLERQVDHDTAEAVKRITRSASERVARFACDYAVQGGRRRVAAIHKANVLHLTDGLFLESVRSVVAGYAGLEFDEQAIDAACYLLVKRPELFDVMVLPNQYGDIISDLAAGLVGSLGLAPGGNIGDRAAMFEAAHGAAPSIAGEGIANPVGLILSGAMLLDHLGEHAAAERIRHGVARVLSEGRTLTPDLDGKATTSELTSAICRAIQEG